MTSDNKELRVEEVHGPIFDKYQKQCSLFSDRPMWKYWPSGCVLSRMYLNYAERIRSLEVREDDVWLLTYPKCGTSWMQEMTWLLVRNLDYDTAKKIDATKRIPFLELKCLHDGLVRELPDMLTVIKETRSPRIIKSHVPLQLLPKQLWTVKPKIIYVARNVKDVAVSYYHHHRRFRSYTGTLHDFVEAFVEEIVIYGSIWDHILEFWKLRNEPYVFFTTFEEMKKNLPGVVLRTAKFLDRTLNSDQLEQLCEHLSFDSMKKNPSANMESLTSNVPQPKVEGNVELFMRKGEVGSWKTEMTPEDAEKIDRWTAEKIKGTDYVLH